jgi:hypothetical protein
MAIYGAVPPPPQFGGAATAAANNSNHQHSSHYPSHAPVAGSSGAAVDIEAWAVSAIQSLSVSSDAPMPSVTTTAHNVPLSIPLDEHGPLKQAAVTINDPRVRSSAVTPPPRPPSRRDSQRRRELLLKGKEGSRQRRRWENGIQYIYL